MQHNKINSHIAKSPVTPLQMKTKRNKKGRAKIMCKYKGEEQCSLSGKRHSDREETTAVFTDLTVKHEISKNVDNFCKCEISEKVIDIKESVKIDICFDKQTETPEADRGSLKQSKIRKCSDLDILVEETESYGDNSEVIDIPFQILGEQSSVDNNSKSTDEESSSVSLCGDLKTIDLLIYSTDDNRNCANREKVNVECNDQDIVYSSIDNEWQTLTLKTSVKNPYTFPNRPNSSIIARSCKSEDQKVPPRPKTCFPIKSERRKSTPLFLSKPEMDKWNPVQKSSNDVPKKCSSVKITRKELEYYLPRKSFFSCHDKALKEAGQNSEDPHGIKARRKQLLEMLQQKKKPDKTRQNISHGFESDQKISNSSVAFDEVSVLKLTSKKKNAKKKGVLDEDDVHVEYQPLFIYLKYIFDHPDEYMAKRKQFLQENLIHIEPMDSLVKLGTIYQRGQHGTAKSSIVLNAAHDIRPRFCDPGLWTKTNNEKALMSLVASGGKKDNPKSDTPVHVTEKVEEPPKTEYELKKWKMEEWLKTVNAAQLNKAKEMALADLGEEDIAMTKWWHALKTCNYIRNSSSHGLDRVCV